MKRPVVWESDLKANSEHKELRVHMDLNDLNKVWEIRPLKRIGEEEARKILEKIAKQVQPIMRKHRWKVQILSEFSPDQPGLQGINIGGGAEVQLRLRSPFNEWQFYPYEQILGTMLHELCHKEFGPHNADFYNLLDKIRGECEELTAEGITGTGQGFDLPGRRLGGFSCQPPPSSLRQTALAAAESRACREVLLPSGPKRLGGDNNIKADLNPIQAAAMAEEGRLHDDIWCGSKSLEGGNNVQGHVGTSQRPQAFTVNERSTQSSIQPKPGPDKVDDQSKWQCSMCTLLNEELALTCATCATSKDTTKFKVWSCKFCTLENRVGVERCLACGEWRYSYGPPVSNRGPYVGN